MRKKIAAMALAIYLTGVSGTAYANTDVIPNTGSTTSGAASPTVSIQDQKAAAPQHAVVSITTIEDSAGVLPDSVFYGLERAIENLQLAITRSEEKLAALKAEYATERASEAVIMVNEGEEELAGEAADEYIKTFDSATKHINKAIEDKNEAVTTLAALNEACKRNQDILNTVLEKAPADVRAAIESALKEQDKAISVVNGFQAAKAAFFAAKAQFEEAKTALKIARKSDDPEAIRVAEEKVKEAEALKDELEAVKDSADASKEEVKMLIRQVEKRIDSGMHQVEKADQKMEKLEERASDKALKSEAKAERAQAKETKRLNKKEEKKRQAMNRFGEKARREAERAQEKAEKADERAKKAEEKAGEKVKKHEDKDGEVAKNGQEKERED